MISSEITDLADIKNRESGLRESVREIELKSAIADILLKVAEKDPDYSKRDKEVLERAADFIAPALYAWLQKGREERRRIEAEKALRESDLFYRKLFENKLNGIAQCEIILDGKGKPADFMFLDVNDTFTVMIGKAKQDVIGRTAREVMPGIEKSSFNTIGVHGEVALTGGEAKFEIYHEYLRRWYSVYTYSPKRGFFVSIFSDITKSKQAEMELKRRTAEMERVNSELEAFTYSVSHDLRGPLNMLGQFAGMMVKRYGSRLEAEIARGLRTIGNTADQMGRLIDDLLAFSRISREQMSMEPIDMGEIINDVWQELAGMAKAPVRFEVLDLPAAFGDRNLIRHVIYNLLSNAVKFSSIRKHPSIEVGGHSEGGFSFFHISDNGAGFRKKDSHKLFGVFKRLHGIEFEGTGVGLAIVQRIICRHGGKIFAEGRLNRGATFHFSLPSER